MINKKLDIAKRFVLLGCRIRCEDVPFHSSSARNTCYELIGWCKREVETRRVFLGTFLLGIHSRQARREQGDGDSDGGDCGGGGGGGGGGTEPRRNRLGCLRGGVNHVPRILIADFAGVRTHPVEWGHVLRAYADLLHFQRILDPTPTTNSNDMSSATGPTEES